MQKDYRKALKLEYLTLGYSILEAVLAMIAGILSGSIALISFGLDSLAEAMSGGVLIWRLKKQADVSTKAEEERLERKAEKLVGISFWLLAGYIGYEVISMFITQSRPSPSLLGIFIAIAALIIMPVLAYYKYKLGVELNLNSLQADAKETLVCSLLSLALLAGLIANYFFGLWYIDPLVSILIALFLLKEGQELIWGE